MLTTIYDTAWKWYQAFNVFSEPILVYVNIAICSEQTQFFGVHLRWLPMSRPPAATTRPTKPGRRQR